MIAYDGKRNRNAEGGRGALRKTRIFLLIKELPLSELPVGLHLAATDTSLNELGKSLRESHRFLACEVTMPLIIYRKITHGIFRIETDLRFHLKLREFFIFFIFFILYC
jgi:hypothetical protein